MQINQPIIDAVRDRLDGDPRLRRAGEIAVTAHGNEVTLRGTVGTRRFPARTSRSASTTDG